MKDITFTITEAGINAMLHAEQNSVQVRLSHVAVGTGRYTAQKTQTALQQEKKRFLIASGDMAKHTLRFSAVLKHYEPVSVSEIGLFTDTGVLFAVASDTDELFTLYADIDFTASFGLRLSRYDSDKVTVVADPDGSLALKLMNEHNTHQNPHSQYTLKSEFTELNNNFRKRFDDFMDEMSREMTAMKSRFALLPVGALYLTMKDYQSGEDIHRLLGYGTWRRANVGRALVGIDPDSQEWDSIIGGKFGENTHQLTIDEMPKHNHIPPHQKTAKYLVGHDGHHTPSGVDYSGHEINTSIFGVIQDTGGNQPHNIVQKSQVIGVWERVA